VIIYYYSVLDVLTSLYMFFICLWYILKMHNVLLSMVSHEQSLCFLIRQSLFVLIRQSLCLLIRQSLCLLIGQSVWLLIRQFLCLLIRQFCVFLFHTTWLYITIVFRRSYITVYVFHLFVIYIKNAQCFVVNGFPWRHKTIGGAMVK
jgi:hypothetical protein